MSLGHKELQGGSSGGSVGAGGHMEEVVRDLPTSSDHGVTMEGQYNMGKHRLAPWDEIIIIMKVEVLPLHVISTLP